MGFEGTHVGKHVGGAAGGMLGRKIGGAVGGKVAGEHGRHVGRHAGHKIGAAAGAAGGAAIGELLPFAKGGKVTKKTAALLHKGEIVVPAKYAKHVSKELKQKKRKWRPQYVTYFLV